MAKYQKESVAEETTVVSKVDTSKDKTLGRCLQGRPTPLDNAVGERLALEGLAAKTDEGWVRGWKWHNFYGG